MTSEAEEGQLLYFVNSTESRIEAVHRDKAGRDSLGRTIYPGQSHHETLEEAAAYLLNESQLELKLAHQSVEEAEQKLQGWKNHLLKVAIKHARVLKSVGRVPVTDTGEER